MHSLSGKLCGIILNVGLSPRAVWTIAVEMHAELQLIHRDDVMRSFAKSTTRLPYFLLLRSILATGHSMQVPQLRYCVSSAPCGGRLGHIETFRVWLGSTVLLTCRSPRSDNASVRSSRSRFSLKMSTALVYSFNTSFHDFSRSTEACSRKVGAGRPEDVLSPPQSNALSTSPFPEGIGERRATYSANASLASSRTPRPIL